MNACSGNSFDKIGDMTPARRTERYEAEHTTTRTYRTNLRRIREMLRLTRDEATARMDPLSSPLRCLHALKQANVAYPWKNWFS
ncbi:hypothetical protein Cocul_00858 [Corynebacterium oculi]|uniref:Uncharacterized protein n=1 Tax=Corynebacterium oculi TaxID=1544416 RepID=A0A0Q0TY98_9CORY|nr:hypothetical protein Cocul_00858 [Corynebacterium oculi]